MLIAIFCLVHVLQQRNRIGFQVCFSKDRPIFNVSVVVTQLMNCQHREKLIKAAKLPANKLELLLYETLKQVAFYNEDTIEPKHWIEAVRLTRDVDSKDIAFVALTLQTGGILWTGDKKLAEHLKTMGFDRVINTAELASLLNLE